jgi:hypothetical protein
MTSAVDGGGWSTSRPGRLYPRERPGTRFIKICNTLLFYRLAACSLNIQVFRANTVLRLLKLQDGVISFFSFEKFVTTYQKTRRHIPE